MRYKIYICRLQQDNAFDFYGISVLSTYSSLRKCLAFRSEQRIKIRILQSQNFKYSIVQYIRFHSLTAFTMFMYKNQFILFGKQYVNKIYCLKVQNRK